MTNIPNLTDLKRSHIQVARSDDKINLYYIAPGQTKKTPLHIKTGCWTCPFGRDDQNKLVVAISDNQYFQVEELDRFGRDVCKYFLKRTNKEIPEDSDLPYKSLIQNVDGLDVIQVQLSDHTRIFDNNGVKLTPEQSAQWTSGQFAGNFLLSLGLRVWSGDDGSDSNGKFYWSVQPVQIKVKRYCTLPAGCAIFETEEELEQELERKKITVKKRIVDDDAVVDFDPDVNELMD